jgi:hypothetical protein
MLFPVVVKAQKNMIALNNVLPEFQRRQAITMDPTLTNEQSNSLKLFNSTFSCLLGGLNEILLSTHCFINFTKAVTNRSVFLVIVIFLSKMVEPIRKEAPFCTSIKN